MILNSSINNTNIERGGIPTGCIVIWSGASDNIPDGWALCDGEDGRPDLRDRFVLGAGSSHSVGSTGGSETVTLTVSQMPEHRHETTVPVSLPSSTSLSSGSETFSLFDHSTNSSRVSNYVGSSQPHPNMPPYYTLCYIIKL